MIGVTWACPVEHEEPRMPPMPSIKQRIDQAQGKQMAEFSAFLRGDMSERAVLMSAMNPGGFKLEELLARVQLELEIKNERLQPDTGMTSVAVQAHNRLIIGLLKQAEAIQRDTMSLLARVGPDQGPTGKPRIGVGS